MNANKEMREKLLNQPSYWVEGVNGYLYEAILSYMETHKMKRKDLAKHLEISAGRVSQILNDGEINFSIDKIIKIALKVGKFPDFRFQDKAAYIEKETNLVEGKPLVLYYNISQLSDLIEKPKEPKEAKVISINQLRESNFQLALQN